MLQTFRIQIVNDVCDFIFTGQLILAVGDVTDPVSHVVTLQSVRRDSSGRNALSEQSIAKILQ